MKMGAEAVRELITPAEIAEIVEAVREDRRCHCCPDREPERLSCGHLMCRDCIDRDHDCLPCALSV